MKKLLFFLLLVFALYGQVKAQRFLSGQQGIQITGGMTDGTCGFSQPNAYYLGAALSTYTNKDNRWVFGGEYLLKQYAYKDSYIPQVQFTAEGGYYLNLLSDKHKTFLLSAGGSLVVGYETSNWGKKLLFDGATLQNKDAFIYGGTITLEVEMYLSDRTILLINSRERILWNSSFGTFHTQYGIGLKFIIN